jgi:hypothetical protein
LAAALVARIVVALTLLQQPVVLVAAALIFSLLRLTLAGLELQDKDLLGGQVLTMAQITVRVVAAELAQQGVMVRLLLAVLVV